MERATRQPYRRIRRALVVVGLLGVYTNVSIGFGESRLYGALGIGAGLVLLGVTPRRRTSLPASFLVLIAICAGIMLLGPAQRLDPLAGTYTSAQLILGIAGALGLGRELTTWRTALVRRLFLTSVLVILTLALFEVLGPLKPLSDGFRERVYGSADLFVYADDARDRLLHGIVRPKVFTQEPSHPAKFVAAALVGWYLMARSRGRLVGFVLLLGVSFALLRSPSLVVAPAIALYAGLRAATERFGQLRAVARAGMIAVAVTLIVTTTTWIGLVPTTRTRAIASGTDSSALIRLSAPLEATGEVLSESPLSGLRMASGGEKSQTVSDVFGRFEGINPLTITQISQSGWGNAVFQIVAYMGIVGTAVFLLWVTSTARRHIGRVEVSTILLSLIVIFSVEGPFALIRPWCYLFLVVVAFSFAGRARGQHAGSRYPDFRFSSSGEDPRIAESATVSTPTAANSSWRPPTLP